MDKRNETDNSNATEYQGIVSSLKVPCKLWFCVLALKYQRMIFST